MSFILQIEHIVRDYDAWKEAFDGDPAGRQRSGVRRYRVMRAIDDPNEVSIDLEFQTRHEADHLLAAMRVVWGRVAGVLISTPRVRITEVVEANEY